MSTARLPHTTPRAQSQLRRRYNELVDQVTNTVGGIAAGSGDIGELQTQIDTINTTLAVPPLNGQFASATSPGTANTEFAISHTLGRVPIAAFIAWQSLAASIYQGPTTGTPWSTTQIFLKASVATVTLSVYIT